MNRETKKSAQDAYHEARAFGTTDKCDSSQEETIIKYFGLDPSTTEISIKEKVDVKIEDIKNSGIDAPKFITYSFSFIESGNVVANKTSF